MPKSYLPQMPSYGAAKPGKPGAFGVPSYGTPSPYAPAPSFNMPQLPISGGQKAGKSGPITVPTTPTTTQPYTPTPTIDPGVQQQYDMLNALIQQQMADEERQRQAEIFQIRSQRQVPRQSRITMLGRY
jgi:hypothetical protein